MYVTLLARNSLKSLVVYRTLPDAASIGQVKVLDDFPAARLDGDLQLRLPVIFCGNVLLLLLFRGFQQIRRTRSRYFRLAISFDLDLVRADRNTSPLIGLVGTIFDLGSRCR